jgi:hypothetical protein
MSEIVSSLLVCPRATHAPFRHPSNLSRPRVGRCEHDASLWLSVESSLRTVRGNPTALDTHITDDRATTRSGWKRMSHTLLCVHGGRQLKADRSRASDRRLDAVSQSFDLHIHVHKMGGQHSGTSAFGHTVWATSNRDLTVGPRCRLREAVCRTTDMRHCRAAARLAPQVRCRCDPSLSRVLRSSVRCRYAHVCRLVCVCLRVSIRRLLPPSRPPQIERTRRRLLNF